MSEVACPRCSADAGEGRVVIHGKLACPYDLAERHQVHAENRILERLECWWGDQAKTEAAKLGPKAVEYGSYDLQLIGQVLRDMINSPRSVSPDISNVELGIVFYELGKIARIVSAVFDGLVPSDDNWDDTSIYARMVRYARENGGWP